ncbi:MAG: hypothetical protein JXR10_00120 [Cyclobacteriaceae bacterium]
MKNYTAKYSDSNTLNWDKAEVLTDFVDPWRNIRTDSIRFRALHGDSALHLKYEVDEPSPITPEGQDVLSTVGNSDRVEIFLTTNNQLDPYYGLEIDSLGRILDFKANYHRQFDYQWKWPKSALTIETNISSSCYCVIITLQKDFLEELKLIKNNQIQCGIYRGRPTGHGDFEWFTWIDPKTKIPDFHLPESFGTILLSE